MESLLDKLPKWIIAFVICLIILGYIMQIRSNYWMAQQSKMNIANGNLQIKL